jgi:hypothetical protein
MTPTRFTHDLDHTLAKASETLALAHTIGQCLTERFARTQVPGCLWRRP